MLLGQFAAAAPAADIRLSVTCLCELDGNPSAARLIDAGIVPINLDLPGPPRLKALRAVRRHIAEHRPDIVHTHLGEADLLGCVAARSLGVPVVCTIHSAAWGRSLKTYTKRMMVKLCADRIIAVSDYARQSYLDSGFARPEQLVTIRNGIAAEPEHGSGRELRRELGWREDDLVVGTLSALRALKAHDVAVSAFRQLMDEFPTLKLLIVGRGREQNEIARMTADLRGRVAMIGHRLDVMRCFDAFDLCLHPSRMEALPSTLIEAMAASVPVVATNVGGIPEIVVDGVTGVLVPAPPSPGSLAAALRQLLPDDARRRAMGCAARTVYDERFTVGPWIQRTRALYEVVLAERRSPSVAGRSSQSAESSDG